MKAKFFTRLILSVVLSVSLFSTGVFAVSGGQTVTSILPGPTISFSTETFSLSAPGQGTMLPPLKDGTAVRWIDRLATLPVHVMEFYTWLEENATATGALADVTKGTMLTGGSYAGGYVREITDDTLLAGYIGEVTFPAGTSVTQMQELAWAEFEETQFPSLNAAFQEAAAYHIAVFNAFDRDHPEVFWLAGNVRFTMEYGMTIRYTSTSAEYTVTPRIYCLLQTNDFDIRAEGYRNAGVIAAAIAGRDSAVSTILAGLPASVSRYEQLQYLNQWLTSHNQYNTSSNLSNIPHDTRECVSALAGTVGRDGPVCEAYARAFKVLCDELGIPCVLTDGDAKNSVSSAGEAHMWNYVQMEDENWYAVDVTWNDPTGGAAGAVSGYEGDSWLLLGRDTEVGGMTFIESHPVSNTVSEGGVAFINGPVLSADRYSPPQGGGNAPEVDTPNGDITGDGVINLADLSVMIWNFNSTAAPHCDLVQDGIVDVFDLTVMISAIREASSDLLP